MTYGEFVKSERLRQGYEQGWVADEAGINAATLSKIENGKTTHPDRATVIALAQVLKVDEASSLQLAGYFAEPDEKHRVMIDLLNLDRQLMSEGFTPVHANAVMTLIRTLAPDNHPLVGAMKPAFSS